MSEKLRQGIDTHVKIHENFLNPPPAPPAVKPSPEMLAPPPTPAPIVGAGTLGAPVAPPPQTSPAMPPLGME